MKKPNVIIIMTDDQGYADLSCMGSNDFATPHIDSLAAGGARFTCMYSNSPVCSPSRAALLTGRYPANAGVRSILAGHRRASGLMPDTPTIASALKKQGYDTACIGKWHLGLAQNCRPLSNGFDYFYGFMAGCIDYYSHIFYWGGPHNPLHDLWENDLETYENGRYFTELISEKAVGYIREKSKGDKPFLLYLGYNAPHYPMHAPKKYMDRFAHLPWDRQVMAAMISAVDDGIGEINAELARLGIDDDTIIYYQSDNGPSRESRNWLDGTPDPYYGGSAGIFKGHKFSLFEGGIRVPGIIRYPAKIAPGQVIDIPVASMDIFPTVLKAAGGDPVGYELDGADIMPALCGGSEQVHDMLFWEMGPQTAVRHGDYKLVQNGQLYEGDFSDGEIAPVFLANLAEDPSEKTNLAETMPELAQKLNAEATKWREQIEREWNAKFAERYTLT
ncbi:MAG: sulfatase-like hydrolase/transferase [Oscillospiraceae bacterium]|nr:sulfatase-like hydrolase/transferase [Oscillospiraceae bacterium]